MTTTSTFTCDGPGCNKDCSKGDGRHYILQLQAVTVPPADPKKLLPTGGSIPSGQFHFHNYACLQAWAGKQVTDEQAALKSVSDAIAAQTAPK